MKSNNNHSNTVKLYSLLYLHRRLDVSLQALSTGWRNKTKNKTDMKGKERINKGIFQHA